jgi:hypothetical protein
MMKVAVLFTVLMAFIATNISATIAESVCKCSGQCSLIPPADKVGYPCYQGLPDDAAKCYKTDPLLASGTTWSCGNCTQFGYPVYLRNDPLYTSMELWIHAYSNGKLVHGL